FLFFVKAAENKSKLKIIYTILSCVCFSLGLLSKELSLVFPLSLWAYIFYFRNDKFKKPGDILKPILPFIAIVLVYLALRFTVFNFETLRPPALTRYPFLLRITVLPKIIFTYLRLLVLPVELHMSRTLIRPVSFFGIFFSWFLLGMISVACWRVLFSKKFNNQFSFLLFWALIFFLPQSGIIPINAFVAEHFIYLSSISFFILLAYLLQKYLRKKAFIIASAGILLFYGILTFSRNTDWKDPFVFYEKIIRLSPESFQAHNNLGLEYEYRNMLKQAEFEYKRALELRPDLIEARSNLANVYFKSGKMEEALKEYNLVKETALAIKMGEIENNIGCIYEVLGLWDKALESYKRALSLDPKLNFTHFNIAKIYQARGKIDLAAGEIFDSLPEIKMRPDKKPDYMAVIKKFLNSAKIINAAPFYNDLGVEFANLGFFRAAAVSFKRSLELEGQYSDAYFNLGLAYWNLGQRREAVSAFKKAVKINPNHLRAKGFLTEIIHKK
ncbi:MAG: tetratricopeptide repeat protein, partial [Candidatus Omnitrophica bacterium]|nr:tetratricopeptide repeat protein [Candidatus Omnitrophota bacterium]